MNADELTSPKGKLVMWYKVKELFETGYSKAQIGRYLGLDVKTVRRYLRMSYDEFVSSSSYRRIYLHLLDPYEGVVRSWLEVHSDLSSSQIHDWLRERYPDLPEVNVKTVYNFVKYLRNKYNLQKPVLSYPRQYCKLEDTPYGEYAQADFGEMWMHREDGRKLKVYFFVMVLCRSRKKYVWFSLTPFTSELTIYAHEKAFEYYGGKPRKIIYDQDAVLIHDENLGDYILTKAFNAYVNQSHFEAIFCRKADPESKGKVENAVKYVKYNFLRARVFENIDRLNEEGVRWLSRTANGLPHNGTRKVPDKVFEEEKPYLTPYYGVPSMPEKQMIEHTVQKNNVVTYKGNDYSVPLGTYQGQGCKVWLGECSGTLHIYDKGSGKLIASHDIPDNRGQYICDPAHRKNHYVSKDKKENAILQYCCFDELAMEWMLNLSRNKPRYYQDNLRTLSREMLHFEPSTLHRAFEISLDSGMYNARDFISLCDRIGKRKPIREPDRKLVDRLPAAVTEMPEKTNISTYSKYFS